jgi:hypothetical protein
MTTADDVKAMSNEILAKINNANTRMAKLEDKVAPLSTEVSSVKADQSCLLVAINNIQRAVSPTTSPLPEILQPPAPSRSTLTAPPIIEELRIMIAALFSQNGERYAEAVFDIFSSPPRHWPDSCHTPPSCRSPSSPNRSRNSLSSAAPCRCSSECCVNVLKSVWRIESPEH